MNVVHWKVVFEGETQKAQDDWVVDMVSVDEVNNDKELILSKASVKNFIAAASSEKNRYEDIRNLKLILESRGRRVPRNAFIAIKLEVDGADNEAPFPTTKDGSWLLLGEMEDGFHLAAAHPYEFAKEFVIPHGISVLEKITELLTSSEGTSKIKKITVYTPWRHYWEVTFEGGIIGEEGDVKHKYFVLESEDGSFGFITKFLYDLIWQCGDKDHYQLIFDIKRVDTPQGQTIEESDTFFAVHAVDDEKDRPFNLLFRVGKEIELIGAGPEELARAITADRRVADTVIGMLGKNPQFWKKVEVFLWFGRGSLKDYGEKDTPPILYE